MAVGFDNDDTIIEHNEHFRAWLSQAKNIHIEEFKDYRMWLAWPRGTLEQAIKYVHEFYESEQGYLDTPVPGMRAIIDHYRGLGEELYVISSRSGGQPLVRRALNNLYPGAFKDILFEGAFHEAGKGSIAKGLGIQTFFEDAYHHAADLASKGIDVYLLDKPWNRNGHHERINRVQSWEEALEHILRKEKSKIY